MNSNEILETFVDKQLSGIEYQEGYELLISFKDGSSIRVEADGCMGSKIAVNTHCVIDKKL